MFVRFAMVVLMMAVSLSTAQARMSNVTLLVPERVVLKRMDGQPSTPDQMRKAILTGSQPFGWKLVADEPGSLKLSYTKSDGPSAVVRVDYDAQSYQINYFSSDLLTHSGDGANATIHPTYNMWVKNLVMRIMLPGELVPASAVSSSLATKR